MLLKIALTLMIVGESAVTSSAKRSLDIPNDILSMHPFHLIPKELFHRTETPKMRISDYDLTRSFSLGPIIKLLRAIPTPKAVASDDIPKAAYSLDSLMKPRRVNPTEKVEASDHGERNPLELNPLEELRGKEHDFDNRSKKGSVNITQDDDSKTTFIHYLLRVRESPTSPPDTAHHKKNPSQQERSQIIFVSRAPRKLKSTTMDKNKNVIRKEKFLSLIPGMKAKGSSSFDNLQTLPSFVVEDREQAPDHMMAPFQMKPQARGYQQVWKKGQGLVVDREYDLPSSDGYRSVSSQPEDSKNDRNEQPLHVYNTKPTLKVLKMLSRELTKNFRTHNKKGSSVKQQNGEEPQHVAHPEARMKIIKLASKGDGSLF